jgi:hypothetical protein
VRWQWLQGLRALELTYVLRLLALSEIEREDILAQRLEEMQRILDKRNLDQMLRQQTGGGKGDDDSPSKAAKSASLPLISPLSIH